MADSGQWQSSSVYFSNGKLLGTFTNSQDINRQLLTTAQIPQNIDESDHRRGGPSLLHRGRHLDHRHRPRRLKDLFGSGGLQGGSTITEQYAKNYYADIGTRATSTTKIKEIFVAIKLAHRDPSRGS